VTSEPDTIRPCIVLYGPTASGKSALALAVAQRFGGVVINADSMQIYRDLRILSARPSAEEEALVPHRLYGVLDGDDVCSAARWRDMARMEIQAAHAAGRIPILCGGTGFYIKALIQGLSPMPQVPPEIRAQIRAEVAAAPGVSAWDRLQELDPVAAARIEPMDMQRISRALEIYAATGRILTDWQNDPLDGPPPGLTFLTCVMVPPRAELVARCDARLDAMVDQGALAEVSALMARGLPDDRPIMRAVGVPELTAHLMGQLTLAEALVQAKTATRRYAKRQATWAKNQIVPNFLIKEKYSESLEARFFAFIEENGLIRV